MICYRDMAFCSYKECPNTFCERHYSKIPWDKLPEWMGVSMSDFRGRCKWYSLASKEDTK